MKIVLIVIFLLSGFSYYGQSFKATYKKSAMISEDYFEFMSAEQIVNISKVYEQYNLIYEDDKSLFSYELFESNNGSFVLSKVLDISYYKFHTTKEIYEINILDDENVGFKSMLTNNYDWKITENSLVINEYICIEAITRFGTNIVKAYFSEEISIPDGPFRYHGLPGLILRIETNSEIIELTEIVFNTTNEGSNTNYDINLPPDLILFNNEEFQAYKTDKLTGILRY